MKIASIIKASFVDGEGIRLSVFVSGCTHRCEGCFNYELWDFNVGDDYNSTIEDSIIKELKRPHYDGITFLGGEPLELPNQKGVLQLLKRVRQECPNRNVWLYTGYTYEADLLNPDSRIYSKELEEILKNVDILVDGPWVSALYDENIQYRGSSNQRVIDLRKTEATGSVVIWDKLER